MAPQSERRVVEVRVDASGTSSIIKKLADDFAKMNGSIKKSTDILGSLRNAFFAIQGLSFAGVGIGQLTNASDSYQKLSDKIKVFEGSQAKANDTMKGLARVADNTRASIEGVATIYSRLALSLSDTKISSSSLLFITEQLQNSFRLSGSTAAEATAATIQLSQGLASGTLRGQELRSVLESNALIGQALADELGKPRGALMKLAEAGQITADVFLKALTNASGKFNKDAQTLGVTFQEATDRGLNKFNIAIGEMNKKLELSKKYDSFIQGFTNNLGAFAAVMVVLAGIAIPALIVKLNALATSMFVTTAVANPLLAVIIGIGAAMAYMSLEGDKFNQFGLELREAFLMPFLYINEVILQTTLALDNFISLGKGGVLKDFAVNGIANMQRLKEESLGRLEEIRKAAANIKLGDDAEKNIGLLSFEQQVAKAKKENKKLNFVDSGKTKTLQTQIKELNSSFSDGQIGILSYNQKLLELTDALYKKKGPIPLFEAIAKVNRDNLGRLFEGGIISAEEFQKKVNQLDIQNLDAKLKAGRILNHEYGQSMLEITNRVYEIREANRSLKLVDFNKQVGSGTISMNQYRDSIISLNMDELTDKIRSGSISLADYNSNLVQISEKFQPGSSLFTGVNNYIESAGTLSQNVANAITNTFGNLENAMLDFIKTGKFNFRDFASSIIEDLNRIIIRSMIIRPLAQGILNAIPAPQDRAGGTTAASSDYLSMKAKGAAYTSSGTEFFAKGGVVSNATSFGFGNGRTGVMGEKGPEAIAPLRRTSSGDLGIQAVPSNVIINITNTTDGQVEQKESTGANGQKVIDILIGQKVKEAFSSGSMDKMMSQSYGLRRKGQ